MQILEPDFQNALKKASINLHNNDYNDDSPQKERIQIFRKPNILIQKKITQSTAVPITVIKPDCLFYNEE